MATERTLSIIKPDATRRNLTGKIIAKFEDAGLRVVASRRMKLSTADAEIWRGGPRPGTSMPDAPIAARAGDSIFLTDAFVKAGSRFTLLEFSNGAAVDAPDGVGVIRIGGHDGLSDPEGLAAKRYDAEPGTAYLLRPDGYVAARFRHPTRSALDAALARASGMN